MLEQLSNYGSIIELQRTCTSGRKGLPSIRGPITNGQGERSWYPSSHHSSSQGLEFRAVAIVGAREGALPDYRARTSTELDAERRGLYVR